MESRPGPRVARFCSIPCRLQARLIPSSSLPSVHVCVRQALHDLATSVEQTSLPHVEVSPQVPSDPAAEICRHGVGIAARMPRHLALLIAVVYV